VTPAARDKPAVLQPGEGEAIGGSQRRQVQAKLDRAEAAVTESLYEPGERGPARHFHRRHTDCFYVLEGELTFEVGDETLSLGAGGFVAVPPMVVHTFRNDGSEQARFLNIHAPGEGFIGYLRAVNTSDDEAERRRAIEEFDSFDAE